MVVAKHNDLLGRYHLSLMVNIVRMRESMENTYIDDNCYKVHVYAVRLYFGEKIFVVMNIRYLYGV